MRKTTIRNWFHLFIDFIPLFMIPVFMIYSGNKNGNFQQSITTSGYEYTPMYQSNEVNSIDDIQVGNIYLFHFEDDVVDFESNNLLYFGFTLIDDGDIYVSNFDDLDFYLDDGYLIKDVYYSLEITEGMAEVEYLDIGGVSVWGTDFYSNAIIKLEDFNYHDCDISQYLSYTDYNIYEREWVDGIILNDTDIGSQFMYALYNPIQKMFDFTKISGFRELYQWISLNVFQGQVNVPYFIVYNILIYNFLVDIVFLLYSVLMFVIDFTEDCLQKPFNIRRYK